MPKTGFRSPTVKDSPKYIAGYITYKYDKIVTLNEQIKKLYSHIVKAEKIFEVVTEREEN